jgi:SAM-dependent methyltransferase
VTRPPSKDWIASHRATWAQKASLRAVYQRWFDWLHTACVSEAPAVELGCGPAFLKERFPDVIATDAEANPHADLILDAGALPFADGQIGTYLLLDVFHHLPDPASFLSEAARTLRPGGRVVMIEPWLGLAGRLLYRYVHHEACDLDVDPRAPWHEAEKEPMDGNGALPFLFFGDPGCLARLRLPLRVTHRRPFAGLPWLLSGGFQPLNLLPASLAPAAETVDRVLSVLPATATRCALVLERDA